MIDSMTHTVLRKIKKQTRESTEWITGVTADWNVKKYKTGHTPNAVAIVQARAGGKTLKH